MKDMRAAVVIGAAAACGIMLAGCGGHNQEPTPQSQTTTSVSAATVAPARHAPTTFPVMPTYSPMSIPPIVIPAGGPNPAPFVAPMTGAVYPSIAPVTVPSITQPTLLVGAPATVPAPVVWTDTIPTSW